MAFHRMSIWLLAITALPIHALNFKYAAVFSVDGLHNSDLDRWLKQNSSSTIAMMLKNGYRYENAYTTFPSDSYPGTLALFSGAHPRTSGVWYDDVWDRSLWAPKSNCSGPSGAEIIYDETIDYNSTLLFSGGIDPKNLPMAKINETCIPLYPHVRTRVNTAFELVVAAGKKTAYTDKHPSYDLVRGPSGTGLSTGYFPEINSAASSTSNVSACIKYDTLHVNAFLSWLDGNVPDNSEGSLNGVIPTLYGGNFQSVSVGQKTVGYKNGSLDFQPALLNAVQFVDASLGSFVSKLKAKNLYNDTLIAVCSKHGQSPINPNKYGKVNPAYVEAQIGVPHNYTTYDDIGLVFLANHSDLSKAVSNLKSNSTFLKIHKLIYGTEMVQLGFGNATTDPAVPDLVIQPVEGIIYTTSSSKIAEHGGDAQDDRHVACFVHNPSLKARTFYQTVFTGQIAPSVVKVLGLDGQKLIGVQKEGTQVLPGF